MSINTGLSHQGNNLFQQGFQSYTPSELKSLEWGLRFTPFLCMLVGTYGLLTQNILILLTISLIGIVAAFFPDKHPFDIFYNIALRPLFKGVKLPPNPLQRRLACLSAGFINGAISFLFFIDPNVHAITIMEVDWTFSNLKTSTEIAYILGAILVSMQLIVFTNHFCVLSWGYEHFMNLFGLGELPINADRARKLYNMGATIIDVRNNARYEDAHLDGAINIPLEHLNEKMKSLDSDAILLYSDNNDKQSQIGQELLRKHGISLSYNIGSLERARKILLMS